MERKGREGRKEMLSHFWGFCVSIVMLPREALASPKRVRVIDLLFFSAAFAAFAFDRDVRSPGESHTP